MPDKVLSHIENEIAVGTVNRPEVRNAMDTETWGLLKAKLEELEENPHVKVIIITGAGDKAFIAGADLNSLQKRTVLETVNAGNSKVAKFLEDMVKPTIAAINGYCLGGGCEIALACDIRIASDNAKLGQTEINVGIIPGAGGTQRLRNLVGQGKAMEMILTGCIVDAEEACRIGLVNKVVCRDELMLQVKTMAQKIAQKSPLAVQMAKKAIKNGADMPIETGLLLESLYQAVVFSTEDHLEGISAFLEKREPRYSGK